MDKLGTLEEVDLRRAWEHEAHGFTPWLSEHLDRLSEAIGFPLELEGSEVAVEDFSADILARNPQDDTRVLIENQLTQSDHTHLGQILTYLAGLDAKIIVWVAADFIPAHLSAIKWLNEHTVEPFAFFSVRVKVVKIGNSPLAPVFEVMERPNDWERRLKEKVRESGGISDLGQFRRKFWAHFVARYPDELAYGPANAASVRWRKLESRGVVIVQYLAKDHVGIFIRRPRQADIDDFYDRLEPYSAKLDRLLGTKNGIDNSFGKRHRKMATRDPANWDAMADWLHEQGDLYQSALEKVVKSEG